MGSETVSREILETHHAAIDIIDVINPKEVTEYLRRHTGSNPEHHYIFIIYIKCLSVSH